MKVAIKRHPVAQRLKGVKGLPSLSWLARFQEGRAMDMLAEIDRLMRENAELNARLVDSETAYVQGIVAERACIEGEVRWRAARAQDAARRRPDKARWLGVVIDECLAIAAMIAARRGAR